MQTNKISAFLSFAAMVMMATNTNAQVITTKTISLEAAKKVVSEAVRFGKAANAPGGAVAVVDNGGNLVYLERLDGTFAAASEVAIKKANTAALFKAPSSKLASASYVLREIEDVRKQKGFLTADIEFINYKASSYSIVNESNNNDQSTKDYLKSLNKAIDKAYKAAFNFRVGGELKFTTVMVRLGAAYYGNPYKNIAGEKGSRFQATGGLGYRNKGFFVDLAYVHTMGKDVHFAYRLQSAAFTGASIKNTGGNAVLTVGFKI
jgi:hypothetical protein